MRARRRRQGAPGRTRGGSVPAADPQTRGRAHGGQAPLRFLRSDLKRVNQRATEERANRSTRRRRCKEGRVLPPLPSVPPTHPRASVLNIAKTSGDGPRRINR
ncbi:hypothetical protein HPB50_019105 [Hyalomma asiaticum]|uniref:Uncharacterized protein n=1 Tax=Hyalomma asiaticum TaxID=266040 RepID=A0ACB7SRZ4_HYAAI|nr:hypothetical protein HPB50_019105 [Hyalomma asiaticum]